eukprot:3105120-Pyramimonas_sp.AAC.1
MVRRRKQFAGGDIFGRRPRDKGQPATAMSRATEHAGGDTFFDWRLTGQIQRAGITSGPQSEIIGCRGA